jgi:hypothetical protein
LLDFETNFVGMEPLSEKSEIFKPEFIIETEFDLSIVIEEEFEFPINIFQDLKDVPILYTGKL